MFCLKVQTFWSLMMQLVLSMTMWLPCCVTWRSHLCLSRMPPAGDILIPETKAGILTWQSHKAVCISGLRLGQDSKIISWRLFYFLNLFNWNTAQDWAFWTDESIHKSSNDIVSCNYIVLIADWKSLAFLFTCFQRWETLAVLQAGQSVHGMEYPREQK